MRALSFILSFFFILNSLSSNSSTNVEAGTACESLLDKALRNCTTVENRLEQSGCAAKFTKTKFLTNAETTQTSPPFKPAVLYSMPGSGNTWTRLLLEHSTGIFTGSFYRDPLYSVSIPKEKSCSAHVAAVKAHPVHYHYADVVSGTKLPFMCTFGGMKSFSRFIVVIRDPYDAIWAEFVRGETKSKVGHVMAASFDAGKWSSTALAMAKDTERAFGVDYEALKAPNSSQHLFVRYEDLRNAKSRDSTLASMVEFLGLPTSLTPKESQERLNCAFVLSEDESIHRVGSDGVDASSVVTKQHAYKDKSLVCKMWAVFGRFAVQHGYMPWNHVACSP